MGGGAKFFHDQEKRSAKKNSNKKKNQNGKKKDFGKRKRGGGGSPFQFIDLITSLNDQEVVSPNPSRRGRSKSPQARFNMRNSAPNTPNNNSHQSDILYLKIDGNEQRVRTSLPLSQRQRRRRGIQDDDLSMSAHDAIDMATNEEGFYYIKPNKNKNNKRGGKRNNTLDDFDQFMTQYNQQFNGRQNPSPRGRKSWGGKDSHREGPKNNNNRRLSGSFPSRGGGVRRGRGGRVQIPLDYTHINKNLRQVNPLSFEWGYQNQNEEEEEQQQQQQPRHHNNNNNNRVNNRVKPQVNQEPQKMEEEIQVILPTNVTPKVRMPIWFEDRTGDRAQNNATAPTSTNTIIESQSLPERPSFKMHYADEDDEENEDEEDDEEEDEEIESEYDEEEEDEIEGMYEDEEDEEEEDEEELSDYEFDDEDEEGVDIDDDSELEDELNAQNSDEPEEGESEEDEEDDEDEDEDEEEEDEFCFIYDNRDSSEQAFLDYIQNMSNGSEDEDKDGEIKGYAKHNRLKNDIIFNKGKKKAASSPFQFRENYENHEMDDQLLFDDGSASKMAINSQNSKTKSDKNTKKKLGVYGNKKKQLLWNEYQASYYRNDVAYDDDKRKRRGRNDRNKKSPFSNKGAKKSSVRIVREFEQVSWVKGSTLNDEMESEEKVVVQELHKDSHGNTIATATSVTSDGHTETVSSVTVVNNNNKEEEEEDEYSYDYKDYFKYITTDKKKKKNKKKEEFMDEDIDDAKLGSMKNQIDRLVSEEEQDENGPIFTSEKPLSFKERLRQAKALGRKTDKNSPQLRKGRRRKEEPSFDAHQLRIIDRTIRDFVMDESMDRLPMEPMSRIQRRQFHRLAECYRLKSPSTGAGERRYTTLIKVPQTCVASQRETEWIIEKWASDSKRREEEQEERITNRRKPSKPSREAPQQGTLVGEFARPIADNNLGNRLLRGMGWSGGGLGATGQGIVQPIGAVVKNNKLGLGF